MILSNDEYKNFFIEIKNEILKARNNALKSVNKELINLYWNIWKSIVEKQEKSKWWDNIVTNLSRDLEQDFWRGFSKRNLLYMKKFFLTYNDNLKMQPLVAQISWSHHIFILDKTSFWDWKDDLRKEFYIKMSIKENWSKRDLEKQLDFQVFEKWILKQNNFKDTLPDLNNNQDLSLLVKDSYDFSLLNLEEPYLEKTLEDLLVNSIEKTLKNFGTYFSFVWRQVKIEIWWQDYYIDLLLYHRKLKCFIVIELKTWEFKAEYTWKMNLYLSALEKQEMIDGENTPIWIILCKSKNRIVVEYALKDVNKPIWVASYITKEDLPEDLKWLLPTLEEIERELELLN